MNFLEILSKNQQIELLKKGGWVMIPIAFLSFVSIYIFFEKIIYLLGPDLSIKKSFLLTLKEKINNKNFDQIKSKNANKNVFLLLVNYILENFEKNSTFSLEKELNYYLYQAEKKIETLSTIANISTMLGFFGTVTGMLQSFFSISQSNALSPQAMASGIYEALITTVAGLFVSIISTIAYYITSYMVEKKFFPIQKFTTDFLTLLQNSNNQK